MGQIILQDFTTKNPLELIGIEAGVCWGANTEDTEKNIKRGKECLENNHGRTLEYPQIYFILDGYSAKVIREFYTAIGGAPSRLQSSTRYIDYNNFEYVVPPSISKSEDSLREYYVLMSQIATTYDKLLKMDIPKEDASFILPLGMTTRVVVRTNLRHILDMCAQRKCFRAMWEYRIIMEDLSKALSNYSEQWEYIVTNYFKSKCDILGYCPERYSCGKTKKKN